jgi:hypothetical protein
MEEHSIPEPVEIVSVEHDPLYERFANEAISRGLRYYSVVYKCSDGLKYVVKTWARDELEAYTQVMNAQPNPIPLRK